MDGTGDFSFLPELRGEDLPHQVQRNDDALIRQGV